MIVQQCGTGLPGRSVLALPVRPEKKFIHIHRERGSSVRATPAVLQEDTPVDLPGPWIVHWRGLRERVTQVTDDREVANDELGRLQRQYQQAMSDIIYLFKSGQNPPKYLIDRAADLHRKAEQFRT